MRAWSGKTCPIKALGIPARLFSFVRAAVGEPNRTTPPSPPWGCPVSGLRADRLEAARWHGIRYANAIGPPPHPHPRIAQQQLYLIRDATPPHQRLSDARDERIMIRRYEKTVEPVRSRPRTTPGPPLRTSSGSDLAHT